MIDRDDRNRHVGTKRPRPLARQLLQRLLQRGVDGQPMDFPPRRQRDGLIGGVRRQRRHRLAAGRHAVELGQRHFVGGNASRRCNAVEHAVAGVARRRRRAVRPAQLRRLRQGDQQRRLGHRKPPRLLAEIGERCRANAFEIAAIGREAEIERQHLILGQDAFELNGPNHLAQFGGERALGARLQQPGDLHGDRRAARDDAPAGDELNRGARHRQRVDARMGAEAPVLVGEQHLDIAWIDVLPAWREAASGLRASRKAATGGPRDRPPAWNTPAPRRAAWVRANGPTTRRRAPRRPTAALVQERMRASRPSSQLTSR